MRRGADRVHWDTAIAVVTAVINTHAKRAVKYEEIHPLGSEIKQEIREAERMRDARSKRRAASLGWELLKGMARGNQGAVQQPADRQASEGSDS